MKTINKIGVKSFAKVSGSMYGLMGLIAGVFFLIIFLVTRPDMGGVETLIFGIGAPIFLTLGYGIAGFLFGALSAWLYNMIAKWVGGIKIEIEEKSE